MKLITRERSYTLFCKTKRDLDNWLRVLKIIIAINKKSISFQECDPFSWFKMEQEKILQDQQQKIKDTEAFFTD
jgi:hypothetical protein